MTTDGLIGYRALDTSFSIVSDDVVVLELIDRLWASSRVEIAGEHLIEVVRTNEAWTVAVDQVVTATGVAPRSVLERVHWEINELARSNAKSRPLLHAAAVEIHGRGIAICGASHSGKSTLALALCEHGAKYLSDEIVALDGGALAVAYPKPMTLRRGTWEYAQTLFAASSAAEAPFMADTWFVAPPDVVASTEIDLVVLASHVPLAPTQCSAVEPADALVALCEHTHGLAHHVEHFASLAAFVRSTRAVRLIAGDFDGARDAVLEALA